MLLRKENPAQERTGDSLYRNIKEANYFSIPFSVPSAEARASPILEAS